MNYQELKKKADGQMGKCFNCNVCDGRACKNTVPGPGSKGSGTVATKNFDAWKNVLLEMDTIVDGGDIDTSIEFFGKKFSIPVFAGPVGAIAMHYSDKYNDISYNDILVKGCVEAGICAFTGDGIDKTINEKACEKIKEVGGLGIPTIKPWAKDIMIEKIKCAKEANAFAIATDVDASGLPFIKNQNPPAGRKNISELREIINEAKVPYIIKGIMNKKAALKAVEAGAKGIVVSNHGGRVLDSVPSTMEVLPEIVEAVKGKCVIVVDGGIRTGQDVFKAIALGADACIIARPFVNAIFAAEKEGIKSYVDMIKTELEDTMSMCGARKISEISREMVRF